MDGLRNCLDSGSRHALATRLPALLACALFLPAALARGATVTVTGTGDTIAVDGSVTLREAITSINAGANANADVVAVGAYGTNDTIAFNIAGAGVHTITPASILPFITEAVFIDGYTQPGTSANTNALNAGINAVLLIELNQTSTVGLTINAAGSTIRGLVLNRGRDEIVVNANNVTIAGNFIGTNPAGTVAMPASSAGFAIYQAAGGDNGVIGGAAPADRNLISGDLQGGIQILSGNATLIQGNYIGTDVTGTASLNNSGGTKEGIFVFADGVSFTATNTVISGNLISGNNGGGLDLFSTGGGVVQGNLIGTQRDGVSALGNLNFGGIDLRGNGFLIGGTTAGQGNTIAFNTGWGVVGLDHKFGNRILGNSIYSNSQLGISLNDSPFPLPNDPCDPPNPGAANLGQNYPVITSAPIAAGSVSISGTLNSIASTTFRVEFFSNAAADPSGNGEGQTFIGFANVTTDATCNASFGPLVFAVPPGQTIFTATATSPANNTSEFSLAFPVGAPPPTATPTPTATSTPTPPGPTATPTVTPTSVPGGPAAASNVPALSDGMLAFLGIALVGAALLLLRRSV